MNALQCIALAALILHGQSLDAMNALKIKQEHIADQQRLKVVSTQRLEALKHTKTAKESLTKEQFLNDLKIFRDVEYHDKTASWIPRAEFTFTEILKLEQQLTALRIPQDDTREIQQQKQAIKDAIIDYAQAALTGYDNNHDANEAYKNESPSNKEHFDMLYNKLKEASGWWGVEIWWRSTDNYKPEAQ